MAVTSESTENSWGKSWKGYLKESRVSFLDEPYGKELRKESSDKSWEQSLKESGMRSH